ncbi:hypothetical protein [Paenibacillus terrae]|nr:hypothetical protein [Paenibacillus terrae]
MGKTSDILAHSASWPMTFHFENYANAWNKIKQRQDMELELSTFP